MVADGGRDADPAGLGERLQPGSDVYAVAEDVLGFDDHIAEVDPNSEANALVIGGIGIAVNHRALDFGRTAHRIYNTRKLRQHSVAGIFDDTPVVLGGLLDQLARGDAL